MIFLYSFQSKANQSSEPKQNSNFDNVFNFAQNLLNQKENSRKHVA